MTSNYLFDSSENDYSNYEDVDSNPPAYKIVMTNTTGVNMSTIFKSEQEITEEQRMRRLRILISLK